MFNRFLYVFALFYKVFGSFYGRFHGLIWEFLALFYRVLVFQVFSVAHMSNGKNLEFKNIVE